MQIVEENEEINSPKKKIFFIIFPPQGGETKNKIHKIQIYDTYLKQGQSYRLVAQQNFQTKDKCKNQRADFSKKE